MPTRNLAIMITDIKGFTARVSQGKRDDLKQILSIHERLLAPVIQYFEGTVVKTIGDAFLVRFDSPTEAVLCGVTIQEVLRQHNAFATEEQKIEVRVAINAGDVELMDDGDVMGETVNLAARLEGVAEAGEVWFTEAVYLAMNRREAPSTEVGERTFAGIPYPVRVFKVTGDPDSELAKRMAQGVRVTAGGPVLRGLHEPQSPARRSLRMPLTIAAVIVVAVAAWLSRGLLFRSEPKEATPRQAEVAAPTAPVKPPQPVESTTSKPPPDEKARRTTALAAARDQLDKLLKSQGAASALAWLRRRLEQSTELEPLQSEIPRLDAMATAESIIHGRMGSDAIDSALTELLARYPQSSEVPLTAARMLEGKVFPFYPLKQYQAAIQRGADARDPHLFEFCTGLFSRHWPGQVQIAHNLLAQHFDQEAVAWAQRALDHAESGAILDNAWSILRRKSDPRINDPYYVAVYRLTRGYRDEEEADRDLRFFQEIRDSTRQQYVLAVHQWVLKPTEEKGVSGFGYSHRDLAERNRAALEKLWKQR